MAAALDQLRALTEAGVVERASRLGPQTRQLPVLPPLEAVLPEGLRRGTTAAVSGPGATSLALALVARASRESWVAAVGMPSLGLVWAAELGIALDRLVVVPEPGTRWLTAVAALVDAFDIVVAHPPRLRDRDAHKLSARVREQRSALIAIGDWSGSDLRLHTTSTHWFGIDRGHGHLAARTITVTASGRRGASRPREATLWLPDEDGRVSLDTRAEVVRLRS